MSVSRRSATRIAVGLGAALSLTAMTACGGGGDDSSSNSGGEIKGNITFQTWNLKAGFKDYFNGVIKDFEKENPGTDVKWVDQPAEGYAEKLSADATAGTLPDVVNVAPDLSYPLAKAGVLLNLDKDGAAKKHKGEYTKEAWDGVTLPGLDGAYSYPWYLNTGPVFYNKALLKQGGIEKAPTTYDDMFEAGNKVAKASKGKIAFKAALPSIEDFSEYGVKAMNADQTKWTYNSAKGVELVKKYREWFKSGALESQVFTSSPEDAGRKFTEQKVAMNPGSAHDLQTVNKDAPTLYKNIEIADRPTNTGHPNMYVQSIGVSEKTKNKATAIAFANFVTNKKNQEAFGHKVAVFPSTKGSMDKPYWTKSDGSEDGKVRVAAAKMIREGAVNYTPVVMTDEMKTVLKNELANALQGDKSPKQALDDAVAKSNKLLNES